MTGGSWHHDELKNNFQVVKLFQCHLDSTFDNIKFINDIETLIHILVFIRHILEKYSIL